MSKSANYELDGHRVHVSSYGSVLVEHVRIGDIVKREDGWYGNLRHADEWTVEAEKTRKAATLLLAKKHLEQMPDRPCFTMRDHDRNKAPIYAPAIVTVKLYTAYGSVREDLCEHCLASNTHQVVNYFDPDDCNEHCMGDQVDRRSVDEWIRKHSYRWEDRNKDPFPIDHLLAWEQIPNPPPGWDEEREFLEIFFKKVREHLMESDDVGPWIKAASKAHIAEEGYGGGIASLPKRLVQFPTGYAVIEGGQAGYTVYCQGMKVSGKSVETALARFLRDCGGVLVNSPTGLTVGLAEGYLNLQGPRGEKVINFLGGNQEVPTLLTVVGDWYEYNGGSREMGYKDLLELLEII